MTSCRIEQIRKEGGKKRENLYFKLRVVKKLSGSTLSISKLYFLIFGIHGCEVLNFQEHGCP